MKKNFQNQIQESKKDVEITTKRHCEHGAVSIVSGNLVHILMHKSSQKWVTEHLTV